MRVASLRLDRVAVAVLCMATCTPATPTTTNTSHPCDSIADCAEDETCANGACVKTEDSSCTPPTDEGAIIAAYCAKEASCFSANPSCATQTRATVEAMRARVGPDCSTTADDLVALLGCLSCGTCDEFLADDAAARACPAAQATEASVRDCEGYVGGEGEQSAEGEGEGASAASCSVAAFAPATSALTLTAVKGSFGAGDCPTPFAVSLLIEGNGAATATDGVASFDGVTTTALQFVESVTGNEIGAIACAPGRTFFMSVQLRAADGATNAICTIPD